MQRQAAILNVYKKEKTAAGFLFCSVDRLTLMLTGYAEKHGIQKEEHPDVAL